MRSDQEAEIKLKRLDTYRDGGSLSASFEESKGSTTVLLFRVLFGIDESNQVGKLGFEEPQLIKYVKVDSASPVTGLINTDWEKTAQVISWESAREILRKLEPLLRSFDGDNKDVLPSMISIASASGKVA